MDKQQVKSVAVVTDPDRDEMSDEERRRRMDEFREVIERIGERNRHLDPDEVYALVTEVVEEVRQEMYEREQREAANRP